MLDHARSQGDVGLSRSDIDSYLVDLSDRCDRSPIRDIVVELLANGGGRHRAQLAYLNCRCVGHDHASALAAAGCVEALHQASLVHDDLSDRSATRRGRPSVWAEHGDAVALAAGDHLISLAYMCIAEATDVEPRRSLGLVHRAVSSTIRGQCADLALASGGQTFRDTGIIADWSRVAVLKTGPLLALGPELAAASGGAAKDVTALREACLRLAIGYQILDDLRDRDEDRAVGGTMSNLCLRLEASGLTSAEAAETVLLHAERELHRAAHDAAGIPGAMGAPVARLCRARLRDMEALLHAV